MITPRAPTQPPGRAVTALEQRQLACPDVVQRQWGASSAISRMAEANAGTLAAVLRRRLDWTG